MKAIKMILGFTVFMSAIVAIMLAPAITFVMCIDPSQTVFLICLLPLSAFGFLLGFSIMCKVLDMGMFDKLLD